VRSAGANLEVDRLQQRAALLIPVGLQPEYGFLKGYHRQSRPPRSSTTEEPAAEINDCTDGSTAPSCAADARAQLREWDARLDLGLAAVVSAAARLARSSNEKDDRGSDNDECDAVEQPDHFQASASATR
jgi:hypothetical protein